MYQGQKHIRLLKTSWKESGSVVDALCSRTGFAIHHERRPGVHIDPSARSQKISEALVKFSQGTHNERFARYVNLGQYPGTEDPRRNPRFTIILHHAASIRACGLPFDPATEHLFRETTPGLCRTPRKHPLAPQRARILLDHTGSRRDLHRRGNNG